MNEGTIRFQRRQTAYTQISNTALRDKRMSLAVRGLFALMLSLPPDRDYKTAYLVKVSDIGRDTLFRYFGILEKFGYLKRQQAHKKDGQFGSNTYFLDDNPVSQCMDFPNTVEPDTAEPDTVLPDTENADAKERTKRKNTPPISPQEELEQMFARFWSLYPRKQGKKKAREAWYKLAPSMALCRRMSAALKAQMRSEEWTRDGGRYIPYPATWINGRRWEDELAPPPAAAAQTEPAREEDRWIS